MTSQMERHWKSDRVPEYWRDQRNWPKAMQEEYGPDGANGPAAAAAHRKRLVEGFRARARGDRRVQAGLRPHLGRRPVRELPEDLVPPFSIYIVDNYETQPFLKRRYNTDGSEVFNVWGEPADNTYRHAGHPEGAKYLTTRLLEMGYPMPYGYKTLHYQGCRTRS
jgi:hypothetical protein